MWDVWERMNNSRWMPDVDFGKIELLTTPTVVGIFLLSKAPHLMSSMYLDWERSSDDRKPVDIGDRWKTLTFPWVLTGSGKTFSHRFLSLGTPNLNGKWPPNPLDPFYVVFAQWILLNTHFQLCSNEKNSSKLRWKFWPKTRQIGQHIVYVKWTANPALSSTSCFALDPFISTYAMYIFSRWS